VTAGLYYYTQSFLYLERRELFAGAIDSALGGELDNSNYAVFAQAGYRVTPALTLIAGARFTREDKDVQIATFVPSTAGSLCDFFARTCNYNFPGPAFPGAPGSETWDHLTPKLGFEWLARADVLLYGQWTQGVRSGGYNVRNTSFTVPPGPYGPELQDAFEIGLKSDWFEQRLRVNAAAFYNTIEDIQRDINQVDPVAGIVQVTRNTANATIQGFELEIAGAVAEGLVLYGNAGYIDDRYTEIFFDLDGGGIGESDLALHIPRLSKWSYAIGATYARALPGDFLLGLRVDYGYRSRAPATDDNRQYLETIEALSASATVTLPDGHWSFSLYGRNLLDNVTEGVRAGLPPALGGGAIRTLNEGRVIGVEASFTY
jgi:iron complex outermembrane recepter protein